MLTIDENAPVIVRLAIEIDAPLETVWSLHTGIDDWPVWNTDVDQARLEGPLAEGASFTWRTHGLDITSTVHELVPGTRIAWGGPANGIEGIHVWTFEQTGDRVTVHTEESWSGAPVDAASDQLRHALRTSLEDWLTCLKNRAEKRS
ncbi:SRPBCC family protein [Streptomyces sp. BE20]|uniref:SRPBCC family protein n=1 Tax=Streptomyces sp. BE20 TaxID=3002525 RepID=UPI002E7A5A79|nr:SRPBCC family protein [Streptomyces sp. BE20]MEE1821286.1 SRPBCC family protein [Streptomyces sp. BE20]